VCVCVCVCVCVYTFICKWTCAHIYAHKHTHAHTHTDCALFHTHTHLVVWTETLSLVRQDENLQSLQRCLSAQKGASSRFLVVTAAVVYRRTYYTLIHICILQTLQCCLRAQKGARSRFLVVTAASIYIRTFITSIYIWILQPCNVACVHEKERVRVFSWPLQYLYTQVHIYIHEHAAPASWPLQYSYTQATLQGLHKYIFTYMCILQPQQRFLRAQYAAILSVFAFPCGQCGICIHVRIIDCIIRSYVHVYLAILAVLAMLFACTKRSAFAFCRGRCGI